MLTKAPPAPRLIAVPDAVEVSTAPLFSVMLLPVAVLTEIAPAPALIEPRLSDCASFSVKAPTVPLVLMAPILLLPVRLTVPVPLSANVAAVITPAPDSVAPDATEVVAVPEPTLSEPVSASVPCDTVVVPVYVLAPESVRVPWLAMLTATVPEPFEIAPDRMSESDALFGLMVRATLPATPDVMLPEIVAPLPQFMPIYASPSSVILPPSVLAPSIRIAPQPS